MSKLKAYLAKHKIKQKDVVEGANMFGGLKLTSPMLSQHHRGLKLSQEIEEHILDFLGSKGLVPPYKTIF